VSASTAVESIGQEYIGRWNRLVSTTNWEKGRIIAEWRASLEDTGLDEEAYTDEAWAARVGNVTPQHVGRLRRVWQKFGETHEQYPGLFWSHFLAAVTWDDAEMYLEGAVQSSWSVAQMRDRRWRDQGALEENKPQPEEIAEADVDEDVDPAVDPADPNALTASEAEVRDTDPHDSSYADGEAGERLSGDGEMGSGDGEHGADDTPPWDDQESAAREADAERPVASFKDLPQLPDDLDEALEAMKLAILAHKMTGWDEISRDDVLRMLDCLRSLALAPA